MGGSSSLQAGPGETQLQPQYLVILVFLLCCCILPKRQSNPHKNRWLAIKKEREKQKKEGKRMAEG
jgi:hypothetical protein